MSENPKSATNTPCRVIAYVDGYNLYYSVRNKWTKPQEKNPQLLKYHLKNLVLHCLEESHRLKKKKNETKSENLIKINFYTARPLKGKGRLNIKHYEEWTSRQECLGVEVIKGIHVSRSNSEEKQADINIVMNMLKKNNRSVMELSIKKFIEEIYHHKYKEKQTDVNIAVDMISDALKNNYDKAVLISDDTDFWGLILKCLREGKHVLVLGTKESHPIKEKLKEEGEIEPYYSELREDISELRQYMNNGTLDFYQITKDDIEEHPDSDYIKETSDNKSNNKKRR